MKPIVSVIVPTYKREDMFIKYIQSLEKQEFSKEKFEVIAVHDGLDCEVLGFMSLSRVMVPSGCYCKNT